jgi:NAD(P)-dependent dehydrogenase (short-subunit alcohol dehydrogenase family)
MYERGVLAMTTVITGSASGIGAAVRARLEKAGDKVIGIDLKDAEIIADLSNREGRTAAIAGVKLSCGDRLDRFVTAAGLGPDENNHSLFTAVNYFGVVDLLDGLFDCLQQGSNPAAVIISSNSAQMTPPGQSSMEMDTYVLALLDHNEAEANRIIEFGDYRFAYVGSKNAVARAARRRAMIWGNAGVRLNVVAPGNTKTPMHQRGLEHPVMGDLIRAMPRPLGRDADAAEIAAVVAFLLNPDASYVHGAVYYVDGGIDAQIRPDRF